MQMSIRCLVCLLLILINDSVAVSFLHKLRRQKSIEFQSTLSSPSESEVYEGTKLRLTCTFVSNFDRMDVYWLHNGDLIQPFISKTVSEEGDGPVEDSFLAVTIVSTMEFERAHLDMHGLYQCVGAYKEIYSQKTFHVNVLINETNSVPPTTAEDALITIHTNQALFEPRSQITLMCRLGDSRRDHCTTKWFDPEFEPLATSEGESDLILKDPNFDDHMGLYTCQICCGKQCQSVTSFVYPAASDK